jgi:hypothetical protein
LLSSVAPKPSQKKNARVCAPEDWVVSACIYTVYYNKYIPIKYSYSISRIQI